MFELADIENKIINLSENDLKDFRTWFYEYDNQIWDKQLENDVHSGKLEDLASKAMNEYQSGVLLYHYCFKVAL